ncbi:CDP-diacylglycerol--glycerol-3-phosphate 3-phosphatidyltransferase [Leptolyngbya sp. BL0902]|nr:CDP-diacylglycerol--glycerol-3-phosphate 3-phosphatidyltransferase [Leptolyngbya sp. BL0902]
MGDNAPTCVFPWPMNLPTWITVSRLLGVPLILILLTHPTPYERWIAAGIFLLAAGTDWLDGYLARKLNQVTELGKFLDPLVDKLLVLAPLLVLVEMNLVPAWGVFLIVAREITIAGWRVNPTMQSGGVPGANLWGKAKTVVQIAAITALLAPLPEAFLLPSQILFWLAVALTLLSGLVYLLPALRSPSNVQDIP